MITIQRADPADYKLLSKMGRITFLESHSHSAPEKDITGYVTGRYNEATMLAELEDPANIYHIIYAHHQPAGYSKIIFNTAHPEISIKNICKLERIYLLKEFYGSKLAAELFSFNRQLAKENRQSGFWLYTWKENERAIRFYTKQGFKIVGSFDFKISETHSNPNHLMLLEF